MSEELTPRERGILAGLADRWCENPYSKVHGQKSWQQDEYQIGRSLGRVLLDIAEKKIAASE